MMRRPAHLTKENAARFQDQALVDVYHLRLPYPPMVYELLLTLLPDEPRRVLDVGTGTGELARGLAPFVDHIDAVDISSGMIAKARTLDNGNASNIRWIVSPIEQAVLEGPYALIVGGDSIHWMDWEVVFPKFRQLLTRQGYVAYVTRQEIETPWEADLRTLIKHYSVYQNFEAFNLVEELQKRGLFQPVGEQRTPVQNSTQSVDDYIESFHSRGSLSRDAMSPQAASAFDHQLRDILKAHQQAHGLRLQTVGVIVWGYSLSDRSDPNSQ